MTLLAIAASVLVLSLVWRGFRRLVVIYALAFLTGYVGVSWWLHQHPEHTAPPTQEHTP